MTRLTDTILNSIGQFRHFGTEKLTIEQLFRGQTLQNSLTIVFWTRIWRAEDEMTDE